MKTTYTERSDFTLIEGQDYTVEQRLGFLSDEMEEYREFSLTGNDKIWLGEAHHYVDNTPFARTSFEFVFTRTSKKRFEFSMVEVKWFEPWFEDEDVECLPERTTLFKWVGKDPDWVLMEVVKRYTGDYLREEIDAPVAPVSLDKSAPW